MNYEGLVSGCIICHWALVSPSLTLALCLPYLWGPVLGMGAAFYSSYNPHLPSLLSVLCLYLSFLSPQVGYPFVSSFSSFIVPRFVCLVEWLDPVSR